MKLELRYKLLNYIIRFNALTWRYKITGDSPKGNSIIVFWHGYMLPVWKYFSVWKPVAVVSLSKDGEILSSLLKKWNYTLIRGSSSVGSKQALDNIIEASKNNLVLLTPDGPKGPIHEFKPGAVVAAQRGGGGIVLCKVKIFCKIIFKRSWDKFNFPLPFSKIELKFSEKIFVQSNAEREEIILIIKNLERKLYQN